MFEPARTPTAVETFLYLQRVYPNVNYMDCTSCGNTFSSVGQHYRQSVCTYPTLSAYQKDLVEGVLMGDGCIHDDGNERLKFIVEMNNQKFLQWLEIQLKEFTTSIVSVNNKDTYKLTTIRCPEFKKIYNRWYNNGVKKFPKDLQLTKNKLRMWYVTDGHLRETSGRPNITIGCSNEYDRQEYLSELLPFANPSFYSDGLWLSVDETELAFEYMGHNPVKGFDRKWVNNSE